MPRRALILRHVFQSSPAKPSPCPVTSDDIPSLLRAWRLIGNGSDARPTKSLSVYPAQRAKHQPEIRRARERTGSHHAGGECPKESPVEKGKGCYR
jgi:hypothetical protein